MSVAASIDLTLTASERRQYREHGFFIRRGIIPPEQVEALKAGIREMMARARRGEGQGLPWVDEAKQYFTRPGQLLHPGLIQPAFLDSLVQGPYYAVAEQILGAPVRHCLFGMLASGGGDRYVQGWHRDIGPLEGEEELPVLQRNIGIYTQINAPLFADRYIQIVPGSHLRKTTAEELHVLHTQADGDMPGQFAPELEAGDVMFYYDNLLHRGYNPEGALRWTMHHGFIRADAPLYNIDQGQDWMAEPGYVEGFPSEIRIYFERYVDRYKEWKAKGGAPPNIANLNN